MTTINTHISIITLNINDFNLTIKKQKLTEWIKKQNSPLCCLKETHLSLKYRRHLRVKRLSISIPIKQDQQAGIVILTSDYIEFKLKLIRRHKE